jgi:hypothetical protein
MTGFRRSVTRESQSRGGIFKKAFFSVRGYFEEKAWVFSAANKYGDH